VREDTGGFRVTSRNPFLLRAGTTGVSWWAAEVVAGSDRCVRIPAASCLLLARFLHLRNCPRTAAAAAGVGAEIGRAFDYFKVPARAKPEVSDAIVARKTEVVQPST